MASEVQIVNMGLTLLGESRIASLDDDVKAAREAKAIYEITRDALLAGYTWSFAKTRTQLSALTDVPSFQYGVKYQLPTDCLRLVQVGDFYCGVDLTDYRGSDTSEFTVEGREILTDLSAPLNLIYVKRVTDTGQFAANYIKAFAAQLAADLAEALTQSDSKKQFAMQQVNREISLAIRANAIELPPKRLADDDWIMSRL